MQQRTRAVITHADVLAALDAAEPRHPVIVPLMREVIEQHLPNEDNKCSNKHMHPIYVTEHPCQNYRAVIKRLRSWGHL